MTWDDNFRIENSEKFRLSLITQKKDAFRIKIQKKKLDCNTESKEETQNLS